MEAEEEEEVRVRPFRQIAQAEEVEAGVHARCSIHSTATVMSVVMGYSYG